MKNLLKHFQILFYYFQTFLNISLKTENYMILYFVYISRKDLFTATMSKKTPPKFHSNMSYKTWTNKLEMCKI